LYKSQTNIFLSLSEFTSFKRFGAGGVEERTRRYPRECSHPDSSRGCSGIWSVDDPDCRYCN